jgi:DNA-directed RNA polymerase alpha subunit
MKKRCELMTNPRKRAAADKIADSVRGGFPAGISRPALRALAGAGLNDLQSLSRVTEAELLALHGMGPKATSLIKAAMKDRGLRFRT